MTCLGWTSSQTALLGTLLLTDSHAMRGISCVGALQLSLPAILALPLQTGVVVICTWE